MQAAKGSAVILLNKILIITIQALATLIFCSLIVTIKTLFPLAESLHCPRLLIICIFSTWTFLVLGHNIFVARVLLVHGILEIKVHIFSYYS